MAALPISSVPNALREIPRTEGSGSGQQDGSPQPSPFTFSASASVNPSRSTTPGLSEAGADESGDGEVVENLPQIDLTRGGAGEEEEEVVFEVRARALKAIPGSGWAGQGTGVLRVLKHRISGRSRVLLRADPSGKVILNAALVRQIYYKLSGSSVQFLVPGVSRQLERWAIKVREQENAVQLAATMENCKQD
jgi:hypothetical protein